MPEKRTLLDHIGNRLYAIPSIAQWWAKLASRKTRRLAAIGGAIPFSPLRKPLSACRIALITTGGIHLPGQPPFDMEDPDGDASFRTIPGDVDLANLVITHKYYDHRDADADPNVIFPLAHLRDLVARRVIGSIAPHQYGFMGHIDGPQVSNLTRCSAPQVAAMLRQDRVDCVLLTPA